MSQILLTSFGIEEMKRVVLVKGNTKNGEGILFSRGKEGRGEENFWVKFVSLFFFYGLLIE